jgi:hypothetical protein
MNDEDTLLNRAKANRGLNPWEAMQLAATLDLPLSEFGLKDTPDNRKKFEQLKDELAVADKIGAIVDIVA